MTDKKYILPVQEQNSDSSNEAKNSSGLASESPRPALPRKSYGSGSGTDTFYTVEVRSCVSPLPLERNFTLTDKWQRLPTELIQWNGVNGVPIREYGLVADQIAKSQRLFNYTAAITLAYLFLAQLEVPLFSHSAGIEARVVKVKLKYSYETEELGVGEIINRCDGPLPVFRDREAEPIPLSARATG